MSGQMLLPIKIPKRRGTIQERFDEFNETHPEVFRSFVRYARQARRQGCKRIGARVIIERIRWDHETKLWTESPPKINDNFISRYARKLMEDFPDEFPGFFELRKLRSQ